MFIRQILTVTLVLAMAVSIGADVPNTVNYQGRLADSAGDPVVDAGYLVKFTIWDAEVGGTELWTSNFNLVSTVNGLFSYELGSNAALPANLFDDSTRYLGITIGTDAEIAPRTKLNTVPYAKTINDSRYVNATGDTMTGDLKMIHSGDLRGSLNMTSAYSNLRLYGGTNLLQVDLIAIGWGSMVLYDADGDPTVGLTASESNGGYLSLIDPVGDETIVLNAGGDGNSAVTLPEDAIDNLEILDEPGVAANINATLITLTSSMQDLVTVDITIPADGYIRVTASCNSNSYGSWQTTYGVFQIDETAGGSLIAPHYTVVGPQHAVDAAFVFISGVFTERMYFKPAGTYTFRLEAFRGSTSATVLTSHNRITAIYYPTAYGSVSTTSPQSPPGIDAELISTTNLDGSTSQVYQYDLRDLELKAKAAQLKAKEAELELLKAQQYNRQGIEQ